MKRRGSSQREDRGGSDSDSDSDRDDELVLTSYQNFNSNVVESAKNKQEFWKLVGSMKRRSQELEMLKKMRDKYEKRVKMFEEKVEGLKKTIEKVERRKAPLPLLTWENAVNERTMALNEHEIGFIIEYGQILDIEWTRFEKDHKNDYTLHQLNKANMDLFFRNVRNVLDGKKTTLFVWDVFQKIRTDSYDFNNGPDEVRSSVSTLLSKFMEMENVRTYMEQFARQRTSPDRLAFSALVISARAILAVHGGEYTEAYQILKGFYENVRRMYDR